MESLQYAGTLVWHKSEFFLLLFRFLLNFGTCLIVIRGIYYGINRNRSYLFTLLVFNVLIFFVASLLSGVKLATGFAFGLFAVFSILRYRTRQIPIKEMTFLFVAIIIATINSTVTRSVSLAEIILADAVIIGISWILEIFWLKGRGETGKILYDRIEWIKPEYRKELLADLSLRLGRPVLDAQFGKIDFLKDTAEITVIFAEAKTEYPLNHNTKKEDTPNVVLGSKIK